MKLDTKDVPQTIDIKDFLRDPQRYIERLKTTGQPVVLTVNGEDRLIVQDIDVYQALLERLQILQRELEVARSACTLQERMDKFAQDGVELDAQDGLEALRGELEVPS